MKVLLLLALAVIVWRMLSGRWLWQSLAAALAGGAGGTGRAAEKQARALLGVHENATHSDIVDAHRRLIAMVHPDRGGTVDQVHEANAARDLLLAKLPATQERK